MPFKLSTPSEKLVVCGANWIKTFFFQMWFFHRNLISQKKLNSKNEFLENISSPEKDYSKCFVFEICRNEKFSIQNLTFWNFFFSNFHCARKRLLQDLIPFFLKTSFQTLILLKRLASESCLLKSARKVKTMLFFPEQIESKRFFFSDVIFSSKSDFSIKIELKNWVSGKFFFSRIWLFEKFFIIKSAGAKIFQYKTWNFGKFSFQNFIVQEDACFRIWFFSENIISNSDFQWKSLQQCHAF